MKNTPTQYNLKNMKKKISKNIHCFRDNIFSKNLNNIIL